MDGSLADVNRWYFTIFFIAHETGVKSATALDQDVPVLSRRDQTYRHNGKVQAQKAKEKKSGKIILGKVTPWPGEKTVQTVFPVGSRRRET